MKLYAYRFCPFSRRARIALAELGVDFEYVETDPQETHPEEILGKTPSDTGVPVLAVRDDFVLFDSAAIIFWLDAAYPRSLTPSAREPQALARSWLGWAANLYGALEAMMAGDEDAEGTIIEKLSKLESFISGEWLVGNEFSIADIALAPVVGMLSTEAIESLPESVRAYVGRVRSRPSVREVLELDLPERPSRAA